MVILVIRLNAIFEGMELEKKSKFTFIFLDQLSDDVECLAVIDEHSTCRLDSITHYVSAHRQLIERKLLSKFMPENCNLSPGLRNFDVCFIS